MTARSARPSKFRLLAFFLVVAAVATGCLPGSSMARSAAGCPRNADYELCARSVAGARTDAAALAIKFAMSQVGSPYCSGCANRFGRGAVPKYDCSGLIVRSYEEAGVTLGAATSGALISGGGARRSVALSEARPGDIVGRPGHVAMLLSDGKIVEASRSGVPSRVTDLKGRRLSRAVTVG